jgi:acyl-coenzyme A synthetase/AMP-(fatty) acid ligase
VNLLSALDQTAHNWPEDVAIVHGHRQFRYADVHAAIEPLAKELRGAGIEDGHKVGLMFASSPEHVIASFAVLRINAIVCYVLPASKADEIANLTREVALDAFCFPASLAHMIPTGRSERSVALVAGREPLIVRRFASATPADERDRLRRVAAAYIRFTSGTTGIAKGIIVSLDTMLERANSNREAPHFGKEDTVLWLQPMARAPGPLAYLLCGGKLVIGDGLDIPSVIRLIQEHRVTHVYSAPMFYRAILNEPDVNSSQLQTVKYFLSGGTALGKQLADAFALRYGQPIVEHYGLSECGAVFINPGTDPSKRGSIGVPVRVEVKLVSAEGTLPNRTDTGELLVRGPGLFDAYYKPWKPRDEVLDNGWFRTGDIARRDGDGYYWIIGRTKEVINVGGMSVFPREIEEVLLSHPAVEEALVFGAPEPRFGEVPHAKIKLSRGVSCAEKDLMRWTNEKLSVFKALRKLEFVSEIPKTVSGKPRRGS